MGKYAKNPEYMQRVIQRFKLKPEVLRATFRLEISLFEQDGNEEFSKLKQQINGAQTPDELINICAGSANKLLKRGKELFCKNCDDRRCYYCEADLFRRDFEDA